MQWFGPQDCTSYAGMPLTRAPIGAPCIWCSEEIAHGDRGVLVGTNESDPMHFECYMRTTIGGANHILKQCQCDECNGSLEPDPPGLTLRQAAREAVKAWRETQGN